MQETKTNLITVFTSNNAGLFQLAKSILSNNKIKFSSRGEQLNTLEAPVFSSDIRVSETDYETAKKLLSELAPSSFEPSTKFQKYLSRNGLYIIILILVLIIIVLVIVK